MSKSNYGQMLDQYLEDIKANDAYKKEMKRIDAIERTFSYTNLDFIFPWHMYLGRREV